ncbi:MAG: hypothetical protein RLZZ502_189 [Pseudomonadota bacterium]|jgi:2-keto-3-deoxy-L-rhamnonate aldolase RhmA
MQNIFQQRLAAGETLYGGWFMSGSATVLEAMACAGYDHVVIDMEHGPVNIHALRDLLNACVAGGSLPVVRMPDQDPTKIKHALDLGALNLVFPYVNTRAEAEAIVRACYYPPKGERGYARMHRGSRYTTDGEYVTKVNEHVQVIMQIETPEAMARHDEILSVPGVTGALFGPGDFAMCLGLQGDVSHPKVREAMAELGRYCQAKGLALGTVMPNPEAVKWAVAAGYGFVSMASDMGLMMGAMRSGLAECRNRQ